MENIKNLTAKARAKLDKIMLQLELLEKEKAEIIKKYASATAEQKVLIEAEMRKSEEAFKKLSEEALALAEKVKKLKEIPLGIVTASDVIIMNNILDSY